VIRTVSASKPLPAFGLLMLILLILGAYGCGSDDRTHVSADTLPLVQGARVVGSTEEPSPDPAADPGYNRWLVIRGPRSMNAHEFQEAQEDTLTRQGWHRERPLPGIAVFTSADRHVQASLGPVDRFFTADEFGNGILRIAHRAQQGEAPVLMATMFPLRD
jgi:hypothetical protein